MPFDPFKLMNSRIRPTMTGETNVVAAIRPYPPAKYVPTMKQDRRTNNELRLEVSEDLYADLHQRYTYWKRCPAGGRTRYARAMAMELAKAMDDLNKRVVFYREQVERKQQPSESKSDPALDSTFKIT